MAVLRDGAPPRDEDFGVRRGLRIGDRMNGFVERMAAVENEMRKLTDLAVALARYEGRAQGRLSRDR